MSINENLRQLRLSRGLTQEQVADLLGVTRQAVSGYESGRTRPDIDTLQRLCEIYHVDLGGLVYGQEKTLTRLRRVKGVAIAAFVIIVLVGLAYSLTMWSANHWFGMESGIVTDEMMGVLEVRARLMMVWAVAETLLLRLGEVGCLVLLVMLTAYKCPIPLKVKLGYVGLLCGVLVVQGVVFWLADGTYGYMNYLLAPIMVCLRLVGFFLLERLIWFIFLRKK